MPSKRLWCKWACPFVPQGLSFAPHFESGAKLCRPFMGQHCTPGCRSSRACMWTQLRASKAVFSSIRQIDEKTVLTCASFCAVRCVRNRTFGVLQIIAEAFLCNAEVFEIFTVEHFHGLLDQLI